MEDQYSHGGRSKTREKKSASTSKSQATKKDNVRLTETDPDYPKDIPKGSKHQEKFWCDELREVMNQGVRRVCWTVASTRSLSARLCIEKKVRSLKYLSLLHLLVGLFDKTGKNGELKDLGHLKKFLEENGAILEKDCKCTDPLIEMNKKKD
ncbi:unnamed protein product [Arabis nemorensis]|uniref:Uncharacterized protein n=1 Tax=Arabis nemorensis TaxID=586526 RepID=A0A565AWV8_9BRAS|nr:unnamed protein product [Arabis nemorensis]